MAKTNEHNGQVTVNHHESQDAVRERLLDMLEEVSAKLDPMPAPLPDVINPAKFFASAVLADEREAARKSIDAMSRELENYRHALKAVCYKLVNGKNRGAWGIVLNALENQNARQFEAIQEQLTALNDQTILAARLATFALTDEVTP